MPERTETAGLADTSDVALQQVTVRDLRVAADIGVHSYEIGRRQTLVLAVTLRLRPASDDCLAETIDYNGIVAAALGLAEERVALIETFADRLA